jgi:hypothetical protein
MRNIIAVTLASMLAASSAYAASDPTGPLAPGKPAGVQNANMVGGGFLLIAGVAIVAGGIALVASSGNSGNTIAVTTTGTAP